MREWLEDCLKELADLEVRRMFGGSGVYAEGTMFAILNAGRVYLKTDDATRAAFTERGSVAFSPREGRVLTTYHEVPAEILEDDAELLTWARRALRVAQAAPQKSKLRGRASPEQILEGHSSEIQALAHRLRELVLETAPNATEAGYPGWRLIGYRAPHYFCFIAPRAEHVRLGFEHGHRLSDPHGVLEPMGKQVRFVRTVPGQRVPVTAIRGLIRAALTTFPKP
jgi:DNA transformation protein